MNQEAQPQEIEPIGGETIHKEVRIILPVSL